MQVIYLESQYLFDERKIRKLSFRSIIFSITPLPNYFFLLIQIENAQIVNIIVYEFL